MNRLSNRLLFSRAVPLIGFVCGLAAVAPLNADIITPPSFSLQCNGAQTFSEGSASCAGGSVSAAGDPFAETTSDFTGVGAAGRGSTGGAAELTYYIVVTGGNAGDAIPVDVDATLFTNSLGNEFRDITTADASINLNFANGTSGASQSVTCGNVKRGEICDDSQWSGTLSATAWVGYDNIVTLTAITGITGGGFADAYADPHVYIDPAFAADNPQYSLELNVSNDLPSGAPEPSTWLLALAGIGVVAGIRRKAKV